MHTHTHNWLESKQINLRDRSEDAASHHEGQTRHRVGEGEGPAAGGMKSHRINIHEPSHLSERDSSASLAVEPGGGRGGEEARKERRRQDGWGVAVAASRGDNQTAVVPSLLLH